MYSSHYHSSTYVCAIYASHFGTSGRGQGLFRTRRWLLPSSPGVGDGAAEVETAVEVGAPSLLVGATTLLVAGASTWLVMGTTN